MLKGYAPYFMGFGLLLLALASLGAARTVRTPPGVPSELLVRQLGHDYLLATGDSTSRIPALTRTEDGDWLLPLGRTVDYDRLLDVAVATLPAGGYHLSLRACGTRELFLGTALVLPVGPASPSPACTGREAGERCADVVVGVLPEPVVPSVGWPYALGGLGFLLCLIPLLRYVRRGGGRPAVGAVATAEPRAAGPPSIPLAPAAEPLPAAGNTTSQAIGTDAVLDVHALELRTATEALSLTFREAKLLDYLAGHPNEVLPREQIHEAVWGEEGVLVGRSLDVFISRLRKKLRGVEGVEIQTVHGVGYRFWHGV